jgi:hypothetical protein
MMCWLLLKSWRVYRIFLRVICGLWKNGGKGECRHHSNPQLASVFNRKTAAQMDLILNCLGRATLTKD